MMTAQELVRRVTDIAKNYKTLYVSGCFGAPLTGKNVDRYCNNNSYNRDRKRTAMIRAAANQDPPVYGFDCVCLIKGVLWGWDGNPSKTYGGSQYTSNGVPDIGEDEMIRRCNGVTTDFSGIVPGAVVWMSGHIGVYIGDGLAVECSPKWANGVQITAVGNLGTKAGYNTRTWTKWGRLPYVEYKAKEDNMTEEQVKKIAQAVLAQVMELDGYPMFVRHMEQYRAELAAQPAPDWAVKEWDRAQKLGVTDGSRPQDFISRAEAAVMVVRSLNLK